MISPSLERREEMEADSAPLWVASCFSMRARYLAWSWAELASVHTL